MFATFADATRVPSPLYAMLSAAIARDPGLANLLEHAPATQRNPPLLFAAVHWLLLQGADHPLADDYATVRLRRSRATAAASETVAPETVAPGATAPGSTAPDSPTAESPAPGVAARFTAFVDDHLDDVVALLRTRATQTNEVNRGAVLLPALAGVADRVGPVALVDVGTSAGLNLLMDRWTYRWQVGDRTVELAGEPDVRCRCTVIGAPTLPEVAPPVTWRAGLDASPLDVADPADVDWLLACVWPDQVDRFRRLQAAVAVARRDPPRVEVGDVVDDTPALLARVPGDVHPVVTTSWVLNYLPTERQVAFLAGLDAAAERRDLTLVTVESPRHTPGLDLAAPPTTRASVLTRVQWRDGHRDVEHLATVQAHGQWLDTTLERT